MFLSIEWTVERGKHATSIDNSNNQEAEKIINFMIQSEQKKDPSVPKLKQGYRRLGVGLTDHHNDSEEHVDSSSPEVSSESSSTSYERPMKNSHCPDCIDEMFPMKNVQMDTHMQSNADPSEENGIFKVFG